MTNQALQTRRVPGVPSATSAQPSAIVAQATPPRGWRQILGELEDKLDAACKELATTDADGGQIANFLSERWSVNLRFWIVAKVLLFRGQFGQR